MSRIGVLGGTFDPPHLGHLALAQHARQALGLDLVLFVPAGDPYHRRPGSGFRIASTRDDLSPAVDRLAMTRLAVADAGAGGVAVDDREVRREGPTYTVTTLEELAAERPGDELFLLLGADSAAELARWRCVRRIGELARIAVARRGEHLPSGQAVEGLRLRIEELAMPRVDITSSQIRALVRAGRPFRHLVTPGVADYVVSRGLYRRRRR